VISDCFTACKDNNNVAIGEKKNKKRWGTCPFKTRHETNGKKYETKRKECNDTLSFFFE
jgi:hypothetical protein